MTSECEHPPEQRIAGGQHGEVIPRYPLRWGSAEVEACGACGGFRLPKHGKGDEWYEGPYIEVIRAAIDEDDE